MQGSTLVSRLFLLVAIAVCNVPGIFSDIIDITDEALVAHNYLRATAVPPLGPLKRDETMLATMKDYFTTMKDGKCPTVDDMKHIEVWKGVEVYDNLGFGTFSGAAHWTWAWFTEMFLTTERLTPSQADAKQIELGHYLQMMFTRHTGLACVQTSIRPNCQFTLGSCAYTGPSPLYTVQYPYTLEQHESLIAKWQSRGEVLSKEGISLVPLEMPGANPHDCFPYDFLVTTMYYFGPEPRTSSDGGIPLGKVSPGLTYPQTYAQYLAANPPVATTLAPGTNTVAPVTSTRAPVSSTLAPVSSTLAPVSSTLAPETTTAAPTAGATQSYALGVPSLYPGLLPAALLMAMALIWV